MFEQIFGSPRVTEPDAGTLLTQLKALDPTGGVTHLPLTPDFIFKKATAWTQPQITAAQNVLDTAPASSPQLTAQALIDTMPIFEKAILLALIDQLNTIRAALSPPLGAITPAQAIAAVRTKAGQL